MEKILDKPLNTVIFTYPYLPAGKANPIKSGFLPGASLFQQLRLDFSASKMSKCQNISPNKKIFVKMTFFRELSDLEQKKSKKFFLDFFGFFSFFWKYASYPTRQNAQNLDFENFPGHAVFSRGQRTFSSFIFHHIGEIVGPN